MQIWRAQGETAHFNTSTCETTSFILGSSGNKTQNFLGDIRTILKPSSDRNKVDISSTALSQHANIALCVAVGTKTDL